MRQFLKTYWILFGSLLAIASTAFFIASLFNSEQKELAEAYNSYTEAEKALTISERQKDFNHALALYMHFADQDAPSYGNGKLYYNIGNTYFQLGQYPYALLYYYRALKLMPRETKIERNVSVALSKLGLKQASTKSVFAKVFFVYYAISLPEKLRLFFLFGVLTILFGSFYVWFPKKIWKGLVLSFAVLCVIMLSSAYYERYLSQIEGVFVKSTLIFRDAGKQYAKVSENPTVPGSKVKVLDIVQGGKWFKVITSEGTLGYVSQEAIQII